MQLPLLLMFALTWAPLCMAHPETPAGQEDWQALADQAERQFQRGSFEAAQQTFEAARKSAPEGLNQESYGGDVRRWLAFRIADARLRSLDSASTRDRSAIEAAEEELLAFASDEPTVYERDRIWAEANEALADHSFQTRRRWGFGTALQDYHQAMEYWAASSDVDTARERWLGILWKMGWPQWSEGLGSYGDRNNWIPMDTLEQGLRIAQKPEDQQRLQFMIARTAMQQGDGPWWDRRMRAALDALRAAGPESPFFEHAAWHEAQWLEHQGPWKRNEQGQAYRQTDPAQALERYRAIVEHGRAGKSPYRRMAQEAIERILKEELDVQVGQAFLTGSKAGFQLRVRNLDRVDFALYAVDLHEGVRFEGDDDHVSHWQRSLRARGANALRRWSVETPADAPHQWVQQSLAIEGDLPAGAYLLRATSGDQRSQALVLVTEASLVLKSAGQQLYAWVTDARTGRPLAEQTVRAHVRSQDRKGRGFWNQPSGTSDAKGLVALTIPDGQGHHAAFVTVETPKGPAFAIISHYHHDEARGWRIHVATDRPAYRPDQQVQWKLTARRHTGLEYETPSGHEIEVKLIDPRGGEVDVAAVTLSPFGSAFGTFETGLDMPLGQYALQVYDKRSGDHLGHANLFRLEEYKRPEFEVTVRTPKTEDGRPEIFVLGDEVRATVQATTYFGSPVGSAKVEVVLYREPFYPQPMRRGRFQWFSDSLVPGWQRHGGYRSWNREEVKREELITDPEGRAEVRFNTPFGEGQEYQYTIEARVTDASRREVTGVGQVRVRRQAYRAELELEHRIHRPGGVARVEVHTLDANDQPVSVPGKLYLYKAEWVEVWTGPDDKPVPPAEVRRRRAGLHFPPPDWKQRVADYRYELVDSVDLRTDDEGLAAWSPTLGEAGIYQLRWVSQDPKSGEVVAEVWTYAAQSDSVEIGHRRNGLQILLDKDAVAEGEPAQILILSDATDRYVLFSVEAESVQHIDVLHLTGNVKLITLPLDRTHVPNVTLTATEVRNAQLRQAVETLVVPPKKRFLDVQVALNESTYRPGANGTFEVTVLDHAGQPVQAEVSLSLFDGSLLAIAADQIPDPRAFYFGHRRDHRVSSASSFQQLGYITLVADEKGRLFTPEALENQRDQAWGEDFLGLETKSVSKRSRLGQARGLVAEGAPAPSANTAMESGDEMALYDSEDADGGDGPGQGAGGQGSGSGDITVRSDFRETALWLPTLTTGADGKATGTFTLPDSTTSWQISAFGNDQGDRFGQFRERGAQTELPLILRPQMPRFLVDGDLARVSALLTNTTEQDIACAVDFQAEGLEILGHFVGAERIDGTQVRVTVPAGGDTRVDYLVRPSQIGDAKLTMTAVAADVADGVQRSLPVIEHGIEVYVSDSGRLTQARLEHTFDLPAGQEGRTQFEVRVAPSIATTMLDSLPYLTHYPYGCLEQSLSRFVPTAVAMRTLERMGLEPEWVASASFGGIEPEHVGKTHPRGKEDLKNWQKAAAAGLAKVEGEQRSDGSWGWWSGGPSNRWMTAYATWSLALAKEAGLDVSEQGLRRALQWIEHALVEEGLDVNDKAWLLHAGCAAKRALGLQQGSEFLTAAFVDLFNRRGGLSPYGRALLTLCGHELQRSDELPTLVENLSNGVTLGNASASGISGTSGGRREDTAHWGSAGLCWRWHEGAVEATAFTLRALLAVQPDHPLVVPAMNWLVQNRRGAQWKSTRDTAISVLALCDFLQVSGEAASPTAFRVSLDGQVLGERRLEGKALLLGTVAFPIEATQAGARNLVIERTQGEGPLYWTISARLFSAENPIQARASEVFIRRDVYKLVGRETLLKGKVYDRVLLQDGETVRSGERLEVVLTIDASNDLEYMMIRDFKPAGLEATVLQSGGGLQARELRADEVQKRFGRASGAAATRWATGDAPLWDNIGMTGHSRWLYHELRDTAQIFFADRLPAGVWQIRTTLRAEVPGTYHGLPAIAEAMYVPEIRGNSNELRLEVLAE